MINIPFKIGMVAIAAMVYTNAVLAEEAAAPAMEVHDAKMQEPKAGEAKMMHKKHAVSDEVKKELEEYRKKKKELWEALSPDAKKAMGIHRNRAGGAKYHQPKHHMKPAVEPEKAAPMEEAKHH